MLSIKNLRGRQLEFLFLPYCSSVYRIFNPSSFLIPGLSEVEGEERGTGGIAATCSVPQTAERGLRRAGESSEEGRQQSPLLVLLNLIHHTQPRSVPPPQVITKDSNVMIVAVAGNIVTGLAKGLRKAYLPYAAVVSQASQLDYFCKVISCLKCSWAHGAACLVFTKLFNSFSHLRLWLASLTNSRRRSKMWLHLFARRQTPSTSL